MGSHIHKHWQNQHEGRQTEFKFKVISFHRSALERQIAEAVRISRTGGERIMNSKGVYNRCELVRIIAKETVETPFLGDMEAATTDEEQGDVASDKDGLMVGNRS